MSTVATTRNSYSPALWLAGPVVFIILFFIVPIGQVAIQSVTDTDGGFTLKAYRTVLESGYYARVIAYTLTLSAKVTLLCLVFGYVVAYFVSSLRSALARKVAIILMITPLFTSNIVRSFAWIMILGRKGIVNETLAGTGIIANPLPLLYSDFAITIGLVYVMLPFMILNIYSSLQNIDTSLTDAAADLGAGLVPRFTTVIWPLSLPGVISGSVIVFALTSSAYVTPMVMSGGKTAVLSMLVYQQYAVVFDAQVGAALSITLLFLALAALGLGVFLGWALSALRGYRRVTQLRRATT